MSDLLQITKLANQIATLTEVDEVLEIRDKAKALKAYVRTKEDGERAVQSLEEIILRANVRIGELLPPAQSSGPGRGNKTSPERGGFSSQEASRLRSLAKAAEEHGGPDALIAKRREAGKSLSLRAIAGEGKGTGTKRGKRKPPPRADQLDEVLGRGVDESEVDDSMRIAGTMDQVREARKILKAVMSWDPNAIGKVGWDRLSSEVRGLIQDLTAFVNKRDSSATLTVVS